MNDEHEHELVEYTNVKHTSLNFDKFILPIHDRLNMNFMSKHNDSNRVKCIIMSRDASSMQCYIGKFWY
ncbi:hypothetical protein BLOT_014741 [Blomia tropicalis]|nr:hypothetical protein BLOT_014741 [Blomia tropicalis]